MATAPRTPLPVGHRFRSPNFGNPAVTTRTSFDDPPGFPTPQTPNSPRPNSRTSWTPLARRDSMEPSPLPSPAMSPLRARKPSFSSPISPIKMSFANPFGSNANTSQATDLRNSSQTKRRTSNTQLPTAVEENVQSLAESNSSNESAKDLEKTVEQLRRENKNLKKKLFKVEEVKENDPRLSVNGEVGNWQDMDQDMDQEMEMEALNEENDRLANLLAAHTECISEQSLALKQAQDHISALERAFAKLRARERTTTTVAVTQPEEQHTRRVGRVRDTEPTKRERPPSAASATINEPKPRLRRMRSVPSLTAASTGRNESWTTSWKEQAAASGASSESDSADRRRSEQMLEERRRPYASPNTSAISLSPPAVTSRVTRHSRDSISSATSGQSGSILGRRMSRTSSRPPSRARSPTRSPSPLASPRKQTTVKPIVYSETPRNLRRATRSRPSSYHENYQDGMSSLMSNRVYDEADVDEFLTSDERFEIDDPYPDAEKQQLEDEEYIDKDWDLRGSAREEKATNYRNDPVPRQRVPYARRATTSNSPSSTSPSVITASKHYRDTSATEDPQETFERLARQREQLDRRLAQLRAQGYRRVRRLSSSPSLRGPSTEADQKSENSSSPTESRMHSRTNSSNVPSPSSRTSPSPLILPVKTSQRRSQTPNAPTGSNSRPPSPLRYEPTTSRTLRHARSHQSLSLAAAASATKNQTDRPTIITTTRTFQRRPSSATSSSNDGRSIGTGSLTQAESSSFTAVSSPASSGGWDDVYPEPTKKSGLKGTERERERVRELERAGGRFGRLDREREREREELGRGW